MNETPAQRIPGLTPWVCEYTKDGSRFGIVLHGESADWPFDFKVEYVSMWVDDEGNEHITVREPKP